MDFGSSSIVNLKQEKLTGTPLYMSPEQIPLMQEYQQTGVLPSAEFDPYMSDVYSLGMTFLHVALMEPPIKVLTNNRHAALTEYLGMLSGSYPSFCWYLGCMLIDDPFQRWSFENLLNNLRQNLPQPYVEQCAESYQPTAPAEMPAVQPVEETIQYPPPAPQFAEGNQQLSVLNHSYSGADQGFYDPTGENPCTEVPPTFVQSTSYSPQVYPAQVPTNPDATDQSSDFIWPGTGKDPFADTSLATMLSKHKEMKVKWLLDYSNIEGEITEKVTYLIKCKLTNCFEAKLSARCTVCQSETQITEAQAPVCRSHWLLCENCLPTHDACPDRIPVR